MKTIEEINTEIKALQEEKKVIRAKKIKENVLEKRITTLLNKSIIGKACGFIILKDINLYSDGYIGEEKYIAVEDTSSFHKYIECEELVITSKYNEFIRINLSAETIEKIELDHNDKTIIAPNFRDKKELDKFFKLEERLIKFVKNYNEQGVK